MEKKWAVKSVLALATTLLMSGTVVNSVQAAKLPIEYDNHKKPVKDGTLRVGVSENGVFKGVFADVLRSDAPTSEVAQFGEISLFRVNDDYTYAKGGLANVSIDYGKKEATVKLKKNAGWSDGQPLEAKDLEYTYEVAANRATGSADYNGQLQTIEGIKEYHDGKADKISGLEIKDKKTLVIHFKELEPEIKFPHAGYILSTAMPYHYLKDVLFDKLASSDKLQEHPLFYGPFKIKNMVRGESIEWVPNKYYGGKKPNVSKVDVEMVSPSKSAAAMRANKFDVLLYENGSTYNKVRKLSQYVVLGEKAKYYSYLGFKVGRVNDKGESVMDRKTPVQNRALRQAMGYALNTDQFDKKFSYGLAYRANTIVPDVFGKYNNHKAKGYTLDLKKANKLLDKAGFRMQKDGYRTLPNGKKFTLKLLAPMGSGPMNDRTAIDVYFEQWKKLGSKLN